MNVPAEHQEPIDAWLTSGGPSGHRIEVMIMIIMIIMIIVITCNNNDDNNDNTQCIYTI